MKLFAQISKVDEQKRLVYGRAVQEVADNSGEIYDYETSKPYFKSWSEDFEKSTDGKSLGNIRAMHGTIAAGKATSVDFDDKEKAVDITAKVVDDNEWKKVIEGVYTGFSIGGRYIKKWTDGDLVRYTASPNEISLVDKPCIPTAKFFDIIKSDGSVIQQEFKMGDLAEEMKKVQAKAIDDLALLIDSGDISPMRLVELAKSDKKTKDEGEDKESTTKDAPKKAPESSDDGGDEEDEKSSKDPKKADDGELKKSIYNVRTFADSLQSLAYLCSSCDSESQYEGDDSPIPEQLRTWIAAGAEIFKAMAEEEINELVESLKSKSIMTPMYMADKGELAKAGARHSADDIGHLQKAHDSLVSLGAKCDKADTTTKDLPAPAGGHDASMSTPQQITGDPLKNKSDTSGDLLKSELQIKKIESLEDMLKKSTDTMNELAARLKKVEDMPMPAKGALLSVTKGQEIQDSVPQVTPVMKSDGTIDEAATLIKMSHQNVRKMFAAP